MTNKPVTQNQIAVVGLATMGHNLAKNLANHGYKVAVYNRTPEKTQSLLDENITNILGYTNLNELINSLETPARILLMVKSGQPVDDVIAELLPLLPTNSILIDGGNSHYRDTERRQKMLMECPKKVHLISCGISGGSVGALNGASIMPSGDEEVVNEMLPIFKAISAHDFKNIPTTTNVGTGASGHFVKMVHNGIEYAMLQAVAEAYSIYKENGFSQELIIGEFKMLNRELLQSFVLENAIEALQMKDENGNFLLPKVDVAAGAKGTGRWTVEAGLEYGVDISIIALAVFARIASNGESGYRSVTKIYGDSADYLNSGVEVLLEDAYKKSFYQGLKLIKVASELNNWNVDINEVIRIWQGGCIIRCQILNNINNFNETNFDKMIFPTNLTQLQRHIFGDHEIKINVK
jgi:6-phosphogluconate dehydrogenase